MSDASAQPSSVTGEAPAGGVILRPASVTTPLPFAAIFDLSRPVELDLGCGKGRFLLARAAAYPETQYLGVDRLLRRIRKLERKIGRLGLGNVRLLRIEGAYALRHLLPRHAFRRIYLFFPDPWPKRRHHKRRLFNDDFRSLLWNALAPGGEVQIATDHLDYFAEMRAGLLADPRFEEIPAMVRSEAEWTDFELIFRRQGLPVGACGFRALPRSGNGAGGHPPDTPAADPSSAGAS